MEAKQLHDQALDTFLSAWLLHIRTKTTDVTLHNALEGVIEKLQDAFHYVGEKGEDNGQPVDPRDQHALTTELYGKVTALLDSVAAAEKGDATSGERNLLAATADGLESAAGTLMQFAKKAQEEASEPSEPTE